VGDTPQGDRIGSAVKTLLVATVAALALVAAVTAFGAGQPPITVETSVSPRSIYFADVVTARVDVFVDPRRVDPTSLQLLTPFGSWHQLQAVREASTTGSTVVRRTWWFTIACFAQNCVPEVKRVDSVALPKLTVVGRTTGGSTVTVHQAWPTINIGTRFAPPGVHALVNLHANTLVPALGFRFDPSWVWVILVVAGALLIVLGLTFATRECLRWRATRRTHVDDRPVLVRSLALVRQAESGEIEERRRAVGLLARILPTDGNGLASAASAVAWSTDDPSPDDLENLARRVEAELEEAG
jgi:hypothetical protein